jgi:tripartite-type tricarboxylate transporter receptor subunit TctC
MRTLAAALIALLALAAVGGAGSVAAQTYPTKPVRLIVPYAPGGSADNAARPYAEKLSLMLGQQFVIENRGGAAGAIGAEAVAKAAPDGYTLLLSPMGPLVVLPNLRKTPYDPSKDFTPIARVAESIAALGIWPGLGAKTMQEFIAAVKAKPGHYHYASPGIGSLAHVRAEVFKTLAGIDMGHIPYRGSGESLNDLMSGNVVALFEGVTMQYHRAGKLNVVAVLESRRHPHYPDIPTVGEAGLKDYDLPNWYVFAGPAGLPVHMVRMLNKAASEIAAMPDQVERLYTAGFQPLSDTPEGTAQAIASELAKYARLIQQYGITAQ